MSPDSAGTRRHAWFAMVGAAAIACGVFAVLQRVDPAPDASSRMSPGRALGTTLEPGTSPASSTTSPAPQLDPSADAIDAGAEALWEIRGTVVDPDGHPVPDVLVELVPVGSEDSGQAPSNLTEPAGLLLADVSPSARPDNLGVTQGRIPPIPLIGQARLDDDLVASFVSDTHGHFALTGSQDGPVELLAAPAGWAPSRSGPIAVVPGARIDALILPLRRGARLEGGTVDSRGDPVAGVKIETFCPGDPVPRSTLSDRDGHYVLAGLLGQCEVIATPIDLPPTQVTVLAVEGAAQLLDLHIAAESHTLECSIEDERRFPIARAAVEVHGASGPGVLAAGLSGPDGQVTIPRLPAPPYRVTVSHPDYAPRIGVPITAAAGNHIQLTTGMRVTGTVALEPGAAPLPGARVEVWSAAGLLVHSTRTGDLGTFEIRNITNGDYSIIVSNPRTVQARFERQARAQGAHDRLTDWGTLRVHEGGSISGTVVDRLGVPVPAAHVFAVGSETITDADGTFTLAGLNGGAVTVQARHPSAGATDRSVTVRAFPGQDTPGVRLQLQGRVDVSAPPAQASSQDAPDPSNAAAPQTADGVPPGSTLVLATGPRGVVVVSVLPGSPPANAGLRPGDVVTSIDGETVSIAGQARSLLRGEAGTWVNVDVRRTNGKQRIRFRRERATAP